MTVQEIGKTSRSTTSERRDIRNGNNFAHQRKIKEGNMGIMSGKEVEAPEDIKKILEPNEEILEGVRQAGIGGKIAGVESVFLTNKRMIKLKPNTSGLRVEIEDYLYKDIANVKLDKGILRSSIIIATRFHTDPIIIENIPKEAANKIYTFINGVKRSSLYVCKVL